MSESLPKLFRVYRHYKGGLYRVLAISRDERTGADFVVYVSLGDGHVWHRPVSEWSTLVGDGCGPSPRFTLEADL